MAYPCNRASTGPAKSVSQAYCFFFFPIFYACNSIRQQYRTFELSDVSDDKHTVDCGEKKKNLYRFDRVARVRESVRIIINIFRIPCRFLCPECQTRCNIKYIEKKKYIYIYRRRGRWRVGTRVPNVGTHANVNIEIST